MDRDELRDSASGSPANGAGMNRSDPMTGHRLPPAAALPQGPCWARGPGPETQPAHDKAHAAHAAIPPKPHCVPPVPPVSKFTVSEFNLLRSYGKSRYLSSIDYREGFERFHPEALEMSRLLDVADIVLQAAGEVEFMRGLHRQEARRRAAASRARRRDRGGR